MSVLLVVAAGFGALVAWVALAVSGELLGKEAAGLLGALAQRLVRKAAQWQPVALAQDYEDENLDLVRCYIGDDRPLSALCVALFEWRRAAWTVGIPTWLLREESNRPERLALSFGFDLAGAVVVGLVVAIVAGPSSGLLVGLCVGLVGLVGTLAYTAVGGLPFRLTSGVVFGAFFGLGIGLGFGLAFGAAVGLASWLGGTAVGIANGVIAGLLEGSSRSRIVGTGFGLLVGLVGALMLGAVSGIAIAVLGLMTGRLDLWAPSLGQRLRHCLATKSTFS